MHRIEYKDYCSYIEVLWSAILWLLAKSEDQTEDVQHDLSSVLSKMLQSIYIVGIVYIYMLCLCVSTYEQLYNTVTNECVYTEELVLHITVH